MMRDRWKHHHWRKHKHRHSIFLKLLIIFSLTGVSVICLVMTFHHFLLQPEGRGYLQQNISQYVNYIIEDVGVPPDKIKAQKLASELSLEIGYEGPDMKWSTFDEMPSIESIKSHFDNPADVNGWHRGKFYHISEKNGYNFIVASSFKNQMAMRGELILFMMFLILLILTGTWAAIRWVLKPIKWLTEGLVRVGEGDFTHKVPENRKDELGKLAISFNTMTDKIQDMIKARDHLLRDVSHELRSPITRAKVALELIKDEDLQKSIGDDLTEMEKMISEILESEKLINGGLKKSRTNLAEIITETIEKYKSEPAKVVLQKMPEIIMLELDAELIKTVLKNVIENALKYSSQQDKPVEVSITVQPEEVIVTVQDYGYGIPEKDLPNIFEPFYRVDQSRSKETGGYGLGLSLSKKIIDAHEGEIEIESEEGKGTVVRLIFGNR